MSYKLKSLVYLSCFIATFTVYNFSMPKAESNYSDSTEIAIAEFDQINATLDLNVENSK